MDEVLWTSSLQGTLGVGYQVVRDDLRPGVHRVSLGLPDGAGGEATASTWLRVLEGPDHEAGC